MTRPGRRTFLRGAVGGTAVAIGLPRLGVMLDGNGEAYAQGSPLPRRFGTWTSANGVHLKSWVPATTGANFALSEQLAPLEAVREYVTVVSGRVTDSLAGILT